MESDKLLPRDQIQDYPANVIDETKKLELSKIDELKLTKVDYIQF